MKISNESNYNLTPKKGAPATWLKLKKGLKNPQEERCRSYIAMLTSGKIKQDFEVCADDRRQAVKKIQTA